MKKLLLIWVLIVFILPFISAKELITPNLYRRINYNVIKLIESYESYCTFKGFNIDVAFYSLFVEDASIYNDYLPLNERQQVSPKEYYTITQKEETKSTIGVEISDISFIDFVEIKEKDHYGIKLKLRKKINFRNWNNFRYPDENFELVFNIDVSTVSLDTIDCKIESITCKYPIDTFSIAKINLKNIDWNTESIKVNKEFLKKNEKETEATILLPGILIPNKVINIDSYDTFLNVRLDTAAKPDKHIYYVNVGNYKYDIGAFIQYNTFSNYQFSPNRNTPNLYKDINLSTYGYAIGMDFNKKILKSGKSNLYLNIGLGIEKTGIEFTGIYMEEHKALDIDGDSYMRITELKDLKENIKLNYFYLPLGVKFKYLLNRKFCLETTVGTKFYLLFNQSFSMIALAEYKGYYDQFDKLVMDHYYDYGYFDLSTKNLKLDLPIFNYNLYANFGLSYRISQKYTTSFKLGYDYGFSNMAKYKEDILSKDQTDYTSLIYSFNSIIKNNLNLTIGINYYF